MVLFSSGVFCQVRKISEKWSKKKDDSEVTLKRDPKTNGPRRATQEEMQRAMYSYKSANTQVKEFGQKSIITCIKCVNYK